MINNHATAINVFHFLFKTIFIGLKQSKKEKPKQATLEGLDEANIQVITFKFKVLNLFEIQF